MQEFSPAIADCELQDTANFPPSTQKSNNFRLDYVSSLKEKGTMDKGKGALRMLIAYIVSSCSRQFLMTRRKSQGWQNIPVKNSCQSVSEKSKF